MRQGNREGRRQLLLAIAERYKQADRGAKKTILDEFVAITGYHRKHAIRVLTTAQTKTLSVRRTRLRLYDEAVRQALVVLWEASDRLCGKRLKPLVPVLLEALRRHGHLLLDEDVQHRVLAASAATIDRLLASTRLAVLGRRRASAKPAIRREVPVRTFSDWHDPAPGFMEADLVAHSGESAAGSFGHTLVLTDIASEWTECVAVPVREAAVVVDIVRRLRPLLPFELLGIDTDNGSEFLNEVMLAFCRSEKVDFTRSRPYRKNDQAWVEQKNGAVVRRLVGYLRFEGREAVQNLNRLYAASRLFVNFFQPSFKLASKTRTGSRVTKRYHPPASPCARLLASEAIPETTKDRLRSVLEKLDPLRLLDEIRTAQSNLADLAAGNNRPRVAVSDAGLEHLLQGLATSWLSGEVRPTHQVQPKVVRSWRTRQDPFASVWPRIQEWLEAEPDRTAVEVLDRLQAEGPGLFTDAQPRTLQRRVKNWRQTAVQRLIFPGPELRETHPTEHAAISCYPSNSP
jgi:hypothetical protein